METIYFKHNRGNAHAAMPSRMVRHYDLTFLLSGKMCWYVDGVPHVVQGGEVFLIKSGSVLARDALVGCDYFSFNFYTDDEPHLPLLMSDMLSSEVRKILSACEDVWEITKDMQMLTHLLSALLGLLEYKVSVKNLSPLVLDIKKYVSDHISEPITLEDVSAATFFSSVYCSAVFKREMGRSIIDYVLDEKIKLAKLFIFENMPLKDIPEQLGYSDYNYFSRIFKKRTGLSPTEYKKVFFP